MKSPLPIDEVVPALRAALMSARSAVLEAPPGAGKTTRVPLALLDEPWAANKKMVMLQPRRIAARAAAARMASELGEQVGETVGYRVRLDARVGPQTRIEVVTEGLLTRQMQADPELAGIGLLIFDEFHERSLNADLGLALALEIQAALNEELKILVMSATLDGERVATLLGGAPVIRSAGRKFPVDTKYVSPAPGSDSHVAKTVRMALRETQGGILVFLPGEGEIKRAVSDLDDLSNDPSVALLPLYGAMPGTAQDTAIAPAVRGTRKIVLSTAIAETSLTIEDIRVVIDSGLQRSPVYDPATGLTKLVTQSVSLASADQRRGRAGRVAPGVCYRLWAEPETRSLRPFSSPEILTVDLAPFALDLAQWAVSDPSSLCLLDPPPRAAYQEAKDLLLKLEAIDGAGRITEHGRRMAAFGAHPRLSHMMLRAAEKGEGATAAALAAILGERDILRTQRGSRDTDLRLRLDLFSGEETDPRADRGALARAREQAKNWRRALDVPASAIQSQLAGSLVALAYPERVAQSRGRGSFRLVSGRGASIDAIDALAGERFLAVAALDAGKGNATVHLAAPIAQVDIETAFATQILSHDEITWDNQEAAVKARIETRLGALTLTSKPKENPPAHLMAEAVLHGIRDIGLDALPWTVGARTLQARLAFVRRVAPEHDWPDLTNEILAQTLEEWLAPFLVGITRRSQFPKIDLIGALRGRLDWKQAKRLDALAPEMMAVPSGSQITIDYDGDDPIMAVRLQELFGLAETPTVGGGRIPVTLHLLSPARRPVQVTRDLKSFWSNAYQEVKKDLKGRYPKHFWPDDPLMAQATARAKPRGT